jgi:hypothetical protein
MSGDIPELAVSEVDRWVLTSRPSVEDVADRLIEVRRLARDARVVEAHLVEYARAELDIDEASDVPAELRDDMPEDD